MPIETKKEIELEIAYVLFIDIVGYSKLVTSEQRRLLELLNQIVHKSEHFRAAETKGRLISVPTGDGMALVFYNTPEAPVQCALEVSSAASEHPEMKLRMGIHSGPVSGVVDVSGRSNIAGAGINIAQRVMDCGDTGHILVSKHMAEDLEQYGDWKRHLHDLGECEVKHGVRIAVVNLYTEDHGNPEVPHKFRQARKGTAAVVREKNGRGWLIATAVALIAALIIGAVFFSQRSAHVATGSGASATTPATPMPTAAAIPEKSIAVLPFENLSEEKQNEYFTDGVQDEILTDLAKIADLKVISRTSVMQYKSGVARNLRKIGEELGVARVVEGSVQRAGNKIRVNAQLIDARTDAHLWAQTYDRDLADVFAIQSEIAKAIADQLQAKLSPNEKKAIEQPPTTDLAAFDLYTRAKTLTLNTSSGGNIENTLRQGIDLLKSATERDPTFHDAFCQLALLHDRLYGQGFDHTPERVSAAEEAIRRATQLQPDSAETHLARANHLYRALRDYKGAQAEVEIAGRGLPNDPRIPELTGYILRRQGKVEEGLRLLEQALALDPRNVGLLQQIAVSYLSSRRYPQAAAMDDRVLQIKPDDVAYSVLRTLDDFHGSADAEPMCRFVEHVRANTPASVPDVADNWFWCALSKKDWAAAEQALAALGETPAWSDGTLQMKTQFGEGLLARAMHDETRAQRAFAAARITQEKIVEQQKDYGPPLCVLGLIDAALGNKEAALKEGRRAMELLPRERDSTNGEILIGYFAVIAAWAGEKDLAIEQLNAAVPLYGATTITSYGVLKLMPFWDPLRGDPRFEKIVESLAPKERH